MCGHYSAQSPSATYAFPALANTSLFRYFVRSLATYLSKRARAPSPPPWVGPLPAKKILTASYPMYSGNCSGIQVWVYINTRKPHTIMLFTNADRSGGDDRCGCLPEFPNLFPKLTVWIFRVELGKVTVLEVQHRHSITPLHITHRLGLVTLSAYHIIPIMH